MPASITQPGVYIEELPSSARTIPGVPTSITAFVGRTARVPDGPEADAPRRVLSFRDFESAFGPRDAAFPMSHAVDAFFVNGGSEAVIVRVAGDDGAPLTDAGYLGDADAGTGLHALRAVEVFNLLCIPPDRRDGSTSPAVLRAALAVCVARRAMLIVDAPAEWGDVASIVRDDAAALAALGIDGPAARNAALYVPRLLETVDVAHGQALSFAACGAIAGVMARFDATRGVWKAPAGLEATLHGVRGLAMEIDDAANGLLNPLGVNCVRRFPGQGLVVWGARTMAGRDALGDEYKYVNVRRLALYIEESLLRGTQWAVFEPNAELLWAQLRLSVGAFMRNLFVQGAFRGGTPQDAWFVQCDAGTTTRNDINRGIVNVSVGFAPLKPGEFVTMQLQLAAGTDLTP